MVFWCQIWILHPKKHRKSGLDDEIWVRMTIIIWIYGFNGHCGLSKITKKWASSNFFSMLELKWFPRVIFFTQLDYDSFLCLDSYLWSMRNFISGLFCNLSLKIYRPGSNFGLFYGKNTHFYGKFCGKIQRTGQKLVHMSHFL